jgi:hypothetical protein
MLSPVRCRRVAQPRGKLGVGEQCLDRGHEGGGISRLDENARFAAANGVCDVADRGGDDGSMRRHRLEHGERKPLGQGGQHDDVSAGEQPRDVFSVTEEDHARAESQICTHAFERGALRTVTGEHESRVGERAGSVEEKTVTFQRIQPGRGQNDRLAIGAQLRTSRGIGRGRLTERHCVVDQPDLLRRPTETPAEVGGELPGDHDCATHASCQHALLQNGRPRQSGIDEQLIRREHARHTRDNGTGKRILARDLPRQVGVEDVRSASAERGGERGRAHRASNTLRQLPNGPQFGTEVFCASRE